MQRSKKGVAMILVLSLILMLVLLGGAVLMVSTGQFSSSFHQIRRTRAFYAAEAAMQHALWSLRTGDTALPGTGATASITFPASINNIPASDITIVVEEQNVAPEVPEGVYPINITVDY